jgi:hypothetical protein
MGAKAAATLESEAVILACCDDNGLRHRWMRI